MSLTAFILWEALIFPCSCYFMYLAYMEGKKSKL